MLVYGCQYGPDVDRLTGDGVAGVNLSCVAALPPSFLDFVLSRGLADGVVLTGCPEGDCQNRLGIDWTQQRVDGQRDPYLRKRVARDRIVKCWLGVARTGAVRREIERFRARLRTLVKPEPTEPGAGRPRTAEVAAGD